MKRWYTTLMESKAYGSKMVNAGLRTNYITDTPKYDFITFLLPLLKEKPNKYLLFNKMALFLEAQKMRKMFTLEKKQETNGI